MESIVRVFTDRCIITIGDYCHEVELYREDKKLKKGYAYIIGDLVYVYRGKYSHGVDLPGLYKDTVHGGYIKIDPTKNERSDYSLANVIELNIDAMINNVEKNEDNFVQPEDIEVINNNAEVYVPTIRDSDDFLKYLIKKAIIEKKINLKNYRDKFKNAYALNNMKAGLNGTTAMSVSYFTQWCEILGLDWEILVRDNKEDKTNPLPNEIVVNRAEYF